MISQSDCRNRPVLQDLLGQRVNVMLVRSALQFAVSHRSKLPQFSLQRLRDMSIYVSEYRRYALSRD